MWCDFQVHFPRPLVALQVGGVNIITDPIFSQRCSPVQFAGPKRYVPPPLPVARLPRIDVVIIS